MSRLTREMECPCFGDVECVACSLRRDRDDARKDRDELADALIAFVHDAQGSAKRDIDDLCSDALKALYNARMT